MIDSGVGTSRTSAAGGSRVAVPPSAVGGVAVVDPVVVTSIAGDPRVAALSDAVVVAVVGGAVVAAVAVAVVAVGSVAGPGTAGLVAGSVVVEAVPVLCRGFRRGRS